MEKMEKLSLEWQHINAVKMALYKLSGKVGNDELIAELNQLIGYLIATEELKKTFN